MVRKLISGLTLMLLLISMLTFNGGPIEANETQSINPLPGQYATYRVDVIDETGDTLWGWWNISYNEFVQPELINTTHITEIPDQGVRENWASINTTNRLVVGCNWELGWSGSWYPLWIETTVIEDSSVQIMNTNGTVVESRTTMFWGKLIDCWVVNATYFSTIYTFLFDKTTGVCIHLEASTEGISTITFNLVNTNIPIGSSPLHDLAVYLTAPANLQPNETTTFDVTVYNYGLHDETNITVHLFINGNVVNSTVIPSLESEGSAGLTHAWASKEYGINNVTAYVHPVPEEFSEENNQMTRLVRVSSIPGVGVKIGDWIQYDYNVTGIPPGTPSPEWMRVEILDVEGAVATATVTLHMSDGTEESETLQLDVLTGYGSSDTFSGLIIPTHCTTGDSVYLTGIGNLAIMGENLGMYAGARRTTVFLRLSMQGTDLEYTWDKETGILVQSTASFVASSGDIAATAIATATNMWTFEVRTPDINNDSVIDIQDIAVAANSFGSSPGHPRWNPMADMNSDDQVNILDLVLIAIAFEEP